MPSDQRVYNGYSRMIVRRALINHLPHKVRWRSDKGDLSHNLRRGLLIFEEELLDQRILYNPQPIKPYYEITALHKTYQHYKRQPANGNFQAVWSALNLALWLGETSHSLSH